MLVGEERVATDQPTELIVKMHAANKKSLSSSSDVAVVWIHMDTAVSPSIPAPSFRLPLFSEAQLPPGPVRSGDCGGGAEKAGCSDLGVQLNCEPVRKQH